MALNETCPYCGATDCEADFVHIGVGLQQVSPFVCSCGAMQISPYDNSPRTEEEELTGWRAPQ